MLAVPLVLFPLLFGSSCNDYRFNPEPDDKVYEPEIVVDPTTLYYGGVSIDQTSTLNVTISNVGNAALNVSNLTVQGTAYALMVPWTPVMLEPEGSIQVPVVYTPSMSWDQGLLTVLSDDPDRATFYVAMLGNGLYPIAHIYPEQVDFGPVIVCGSEAETVTITNIGGADLEISNLIEQSEAVVVDLPDDLPLVLPPGEMLALDLTFTPPSTGAYSGALWVVSNDPAGDRVAYQEGEGSWLGINEWVDRFRQAEQAYADADVLFYVDQSASIDDDKDRLSEGFEDLVAQLDDAYVDWQAMVVTDDDGCGNGGILRSGDPYAVATFSAGIWGEYGLLTESGLSLARAALGQTGGGECNEGFLREEARTIIVAVSDELEQSEEGWATLTAELQDMGNGTVVAALVGDVPDGCETADAGYGYYEAAMATDGIFLSICATDWTAHFDRIEDLVTAEPSDTFVLTYFPEVRTLVVTVDGYETESWEYVESLNAVVFDEMPEAGASIEVYYELSQECLE